MKAIAEIGLDSESGLIICKPQSRENRRDVVALLRGLNGGSRYSVDGDHFNLDVTIAVAIREAKDEIAFGWTKEAANFVDRFAEGYATRGLARRRLLELPDYSIANAVLKDYALSTNLDPHQCIAVAAMSDPLITDLCLFDEQGSGKTVMTIHAFDRLVENGIVKSMLVFAPKNMLNTWKSDFQQFMGEKYRVEIISGTKKEKFVNLIAPADIYVTNYETAQSMESSLRSLLLRNAGRIILTVDESFFVKNSKAERSSAIRRLRNFCERCWVLCGTPAPNHAIDVVHQFDIADCGVTFAGITLPKDPEATRQIIKRVVETRGLYLRRLKKDVLPGIPNKNFESISVPMEPIQRGLYEETLTGLVDDVVAADERGFRELFQSFLARRMALLQISSNPQLVFPDYQEIPGKHIALDELLQELIIVRKEKVVLWSYFRSSLDKLEEKYREYGSVRLDGSITSNEVRRNAIDRFQRDPDTMLFIANPAAAGAGITLTAARIAVYESFPIQTAHFLQSIDRIHRRGQDREAHYYFLLAQETLEELEYERLLEKERHGFELFGDPQPDTTTREYFLRELQQALSLLK